VISIGNIAVGGTGKTPLVELLASELSSQFPLAIVTRGFKSQSEHRNVRIDIEEPNGSSLYGDEPMLLSLKTKVPVFVGKNRFKSGLMAIEEGAKCILLDDGMQHRKLHRDLEIAIVDAKDPFCSHRFLPAGFLRDEVSALKKADVIIALSVCNEKEYCAVRKKLRAVSEAPLVGMYKQPIWTHDVKKVGLFCGIGKPEQFVETVRDLKLDIVDTLFSLDHKVPSFEELHGYALSCKAKGAEALICTEKDQIKLVSKELPLPVLALPIVLKVAQGKEAWEKFLKTVVKKVNCHERPGESPSSKARRKHS
jgi:tetraacyldisaccharide 4'-kinase